VQAEIGVNPIAMAEEPTPATLLVWGNDTFGQLGLGSSHERLYRSPTPCPFSFSIAQIACGSDHSVLRTPEGLTYSMGSNADGQLGLEDRAVKRTASPTLVKGLLEEQRSVYVACGAAHTVAVTASGKAYAWGLGSSGALGTGDSLSRWGPAVVTIPKGNTVVSAACGGRHSAFLMQASFEGRTSLFLCGAGDAGQLGSGARDSCLIPTALQLEDSVEEAACGLLHTLFRTESGQVYAMGANTFGQLGLGSKRGTLLPAQITALEGTRVKQLACWSSSAAVTSDGQLYLWGSGTFGELLSPQRIAGLKQVTDVSMGGGFGAVVDRAGQVWTWGTNTGGELGLGDSDSRATPALLTALQGKAIQQVACGSAHVLALSDQFSAQKTQKFTEIRLDQSSSFRSDPDNTSHSRLLRLYQSELDARKTLELELFKEQQVKFAYMKQVETLTLESQDLRDNARKLETELARVQTDLAWHSQSSLQQAAKSKVLAERLKALPVLEQKVEDLQLTIRTYEQEKQRLEAALFASLQKGEDLEKVHLKAARDLSDSKLASHLLEEELEIARHSANDTSRKLDKVSLAAETAIHSLSHRQSELEVQWTSQLQDHQSKIQSQEEGIRDLRTRLQAALSTGQRWQLQAERLEAQVSALSLETHNSNKVISDLRAASERQEAKNRVLVEALEREVKGGAGSLRRAKEAILPATFSPPSESRGKVSLEARLEAFERRVTQFKRG